jgi:hypothetical protein
MASTYSALKIELIATGEQSGTWGTTTNNNLGDAALGEAITGSADVAFSSADVTVTLTDSNASQTARNLRLNLVGTTGGARSLILGSGCQIEKLYLINNTCADAITVKNTSGTGIAVPAGKSMFVYNNGTNVVDAITHASSLTLGSALPVTSGGTGSTSTTFVNLASNVTGTLPIANGGTGSTSTTFVNAATNITGTLPVANGGTGITSLGAGVATFLGTPSSANLATAITNETGSGSLVFATSPTLVTPALGTPSSGTLTNCTFPTLNQNTTGSAATVTGNATGSTFGFNSGFGSVATAYGCRAWVNFNGTGAVAIRASGNVSSITDNGTGDYRVNFTTAMPNANYSTVTSAAAYSGDSSTFGIRGDTAPLTTSVRVWTKQNGIGGTPDGLYCNVAIFR